MVYAACIKRRGLNNETNMFYINTRKNSEKKYKVHRYVLNGEEITELKHSHILKNSLLEVVFE